MSAYTGKIIKSNKNNVFSTNNTAKIIENKEKIIQSDSEWREVIKKRYLLSQINLSTVPDVIADAIRDAMQQTKDATLSDALIEALKQSIENLNDGIYKKIYIDNTITYLENLLIQKAGPETVASIADSKIALATADLVSTAQVELLTSRIGDSESEITNVKETINTKDIARALQIDNLSASINDTFATYSNAIELYVDEEGNAKSQRIETLSTNIGLQLQETNQLIVDSNNEWKAKSMKLITNPSGGITGYSFEDGSGLKSNFTINADNFKISNSAGTYTPFSIVGNSLLLNGKVTFSNITDTSDLIQSIEDAQDTADTAINNAETANGLVSDISSDSILSPSEKLAIKKEWDIIVSEKSKNTTQATTYDVSSLNYTSTYNTLDSYLTPLLASLSTKSTITGAVFRENFKNYYDARTDLLNAIATKIKIDVTEYIDSTVNNIPWQTQVQAAINNNATYIEGGKIVTNEAFVNNLNARGGVKASTIDVNNGIGFILNSQAAGTSSSPNIQGGYIKGAILEGVALNVNDIKVKAQNYPNNFGRIYLTSFASSASFTTLTSDEFVSGSFSSGFNFLRQCSNYQVFTLRSVLANNTSFSSIRITLQYSLNRGAWTTLTSATSTVFVASNFIYTNTYAATQSIQFRAICSKVSGDTAGVMCSLEVTTVNGQ